MKLLALCSLVLLTFTPALVRADGLYERIHTATHILAERQGSVDPIPQEILDHARGIAIGTITKAGLGVGGQGGGGIVMLHYLGDARPSWSAPIAYTSGGGTIGAQIGFTTIRYIIILNSDSAVRRFTSPGKVSLDAQATGTAGADSGREGESTDELRRHSMILYKDTGGLYGGATLGGTSVQADDDSNQEAYGDGVYVRDILSGKVQKPAAANRLYALLGGQR